VRIAETHGIGIITVGTPKREKAEIALRVLGDRMVFFRNLVAKVAEGILDR
jgi:hypothetical protein